MVGRGRHGEVVRSFEVLGGVWPPVFSKGVRAIYLARDLRISDATFFHMLLKPKLFDGQVLNFGHT